MKGIDKHWRNRGWTCCGWCVSGTPVGVRDVFLRLQVVNSVDGIDHRLMSITPSGLDKVLSLTPSEVCRVLSVSPPGLCAHDKAIKCPRGRQLSELSIPHAS
jgi:hypothetical protein